MRLMRSIACASLALVVLWPAFTRAEPPASVSDKVSYAREVLPLFQQHCMGGPQPARAGGGSLMTSREELHKQGDSGEAGIVPGTPDASHVLAQISRKDGKPPAMPKNKPALTPHE